MPVSKDVLRLELTKSGSEFLDLFTARYPIIYIASSEEARVEEEIKNIALKREMKLTAWSITKGFTPLQGAHKSTEIKEPDKAARLKPFAGFFSRLAAPFFVREAELAAPTRAFKLSESIADVEYAIKSH